MALTFFREGKNLTGTAGDDVMAVFAGGGGGPEADQDTLNGGDGNDLLMGDRPNGLLGFAAADNLSTRNRAFDLSPLRLSFSNDHDQLVGNTDAPHTSLIRETRPGTIDWFKVPLVAGQTATFDIDFGFTSWGGAVDTVVELRNATGALIATNDDSDPSAGGDGSINSRDSLLSFTATSDGDYYFVVRPFGEGKPTFAGGAYMANVSITGLPAEDHGAAGDDYLYGDAGDDLIVGDGGNDYILGGTGFDTIYGGSGADLINGGDDPDQIWGGAGRDSVAGGNGNDTLYWRPGDGSDELNGGANIDGLDLSASTSGWTVDLDFGIASNGYGDVIRITEVEIVAASDFADVLSGPTDSAGSQVLGRGGDDLIRSGYTAQLLDGGDGIDTLDTADFGYGGQTWQVDLSNGENSVGFGSWINFENFTGSNAVDLITGTVAANTIRTGGGDDTVQAGDGDDVVEGGLGDDTLDGGAGIDTASYASAREGVSVVLAYQGSQWDTQVGFDILTGFENATGSMFGDDLAGDGGDNMLAGGGGDDVLEGANGRDTLNGGAGRDAASYEFAGAAVRVDLAVATAQDTRGAGIDRLVGIESLTGSRFDDQLAGNGAANTLVGGRGADRLTGGGGADRFVIEHGDSGGVAAIADRITDFKRADGDRIDLSDIDAGSGTIATEHFTFIGTAVFSGTAGELRYQSSGSETWLTGDTDGDRDADVLVRLSGQVALGARDLILTTDAAVLAVESPFAGDVRYHAPIASVSFHDLGLVHLV